MSLSKPLREPPTSPIKKDFSQEYSLKELGIRPKELPKHFFKNHNIPLCDELIEHNIRNKIACDTTIVIGKETFKCHSIVLKVHTEYFVKWEESGFSMETVELPLNQVSMESFREIYDWMLKEDYEIPRTKFADIFKSAIFMKVRDLIKECMAIIDDKDLIGEREAISIFLEAKKVECRILQSYMITKICKIFLTFVASLDFLELSFEEVNEFFKSNGVAVNSEMDMMYVALRWLEFEWPKRKSFVKKLFKLIKFEVIPFWILAEVRKYPQHLAHIFCLVEEIIDDAMRDHSHRHAAEEGNRGFYKNRPQIVIPRKLIIDSKWEKLNLQDNPRVFEGYECFKGYLKQLNATHWKKLKLVEALNAEEIQ